MDKQMVLVLAILVYAIATFAGFAWAVYNAPMSDDDGRITGPSMRQERAARRG